MALPTPILFEYRQHRNLLPQICQIHRSCVLQDHQVLAFLPNASGDIDTADLLSFWEAQCNHSHGPSRKVVLLQTAADCDEVLGVVVLDMPFAETGPFRCWVQKLMVSPAHRRQGIARRLLMYVEEVAIRNKKYLLMLDVPVGTPAEQSKLYEKAGYIEVGIVPQFSVSPKDGSLLDEKFFYKDLRALGTTANTPDESMSWTG